MPAWRGVGVEVGESAERRERLADTLPPPFPLEAPQLTIAKAEPEGQAGRRTKSAAKTGGDGILGRIEAESLTPCSPTSPIPIIGLPILKRRRRCNV